MYSAKYRQSERSIAGFFPDNPTLRGDYATRNNLTALKRIRATIFFLSFTDSITR